MFGCEPCDRQSCRRHVSEIGIIAVFIAWLIAISGCAAFKSTQNNLADLFSGKKTAKSNSKRASAKDDFDFGRSDPNRLLLSDLTPGQIVTTVQTRFSKEDRAAAEKIFQDAQALYEQAVSITEQDSNSEAAHKLFVKAAKEFQVAGAKWKDSALEQDALFMAAECYFFAHQYVKANRAYEQLVSRYPGTQHMDLVQGRRFNIAKYWLDLNRDKAFWEKGINLTDEMRPLVDMSGHAKRVLNNIRLDDPTGRVADDATMLLANAHFESKKYEEAADTYEDLRRTYPGSKHQFQAHLLELKARMLSYRGASYDGTQIIKADKIMNALVTQFPHEIKEHRQYLDTEAGRIRTLLAERDFAIGQYFEKRGENRAASIYYQSVATSFAETDLAKDALARRDELADEPEIPVQRAAWLVNLFPEPKSTKPLIGPSNTIMR